MIISPSVSQILRGIIHEMSGTLKEGLEDPIKSAQIDTIIGVLGSCAVRADHQSRLISDEVTAATALAAAYQQAGKSTPDIDRAMVDISKAADDESLYQAASQAISAMSDIGRAAGNDLYTRLHDLMAQRLENEMKVIGGGFEAAGRG